MMVPRIDPPAGKKWAVDYLEDDFEILDVDDSTVTDGSSPVADAVEKKRFSRSTTFSAQWLMSQEFPPLQYVVPGIIPEGMSVLAAAPKAGKSWMVLGLAVALAEGGYAFGRIPVGGVRPVLYLALEDGPRRLKARMQSIGVTEISHRLSFRVGLDDGETVTTVIKMFLTEHAGLNPVVILDTLGKVMPPSGNGNQYQHDYGVMAGLKGCCDAVPGSSLVVVHHTRKMGAEDFLDALSGTQGIAGAADTVLVLKRERQTDKATLQITSRDAAEGEYALTLSTDGVWDLDGADIHEAARTAQAARASEGVGDRMAEVIATVARFPDGISPHEVATLCGIDDATTRSYLRRALEAGRVRSPKRGLYTPATSATTATFEQEALDGSGTSGISGTHIGATS